MSFRVPQMQCRKRTCFDRPYGERVCRPRQLRVRCAKSKTKSVKLQSSWLHLAFVNANTKRGKNQKRRFGICGRKCSCQGGNECYFYSTFLCIFRTAFLHLGIQIGRVQNSKCARQMHKYFLLKQMISLEQKMMYIMQIQLRKKQIMQCVVPMCKERRISKSTVTTSITHPQGFRLKKMDLIMQICNLKYKNQPPKNYVMNCML